MMAADLNPQNHEIDESLLPDSYDALIAVEKLVHGAHNPRRVQPQKELQRSIKNQGINRPLIVRPSDGMYQITDGWQRYQAATACGWEALPVKIYDTALGALEATETESIVREWSTYQWATYCQSVASELDNGSKSELTEIIANRTTKSAHTVRRYLDVLSLPNEVHPLLNDGPSGTPKEWQVLKHYNTDVRRYDGLSWVVAATLARRQSNLDRKRIIAIAAHAVTFDQDRSKQFIYQAAEHPNTPLENIRKQILFASQGEQYLQVPQVAVSLSTDEKQTVMEYCHSKRKPLSSIVKEAIEEIIEKESDDAKLKS